ncbi:hypothetical protein [Halococcus salsus]|nr:hypothetical protein [Halococcus salsus]
MSGNERQEDEHRKRRRAELSEQGQGGAKGPRAFSTMAELITLRGLWK